MHSDTTQTRNYLVTQNLSFALIFFYLFHQEKRWKITFAIIAIYHKISHAFYSFTPIFFFFKL